MKKTLFALLIAATSLTLSAPIFADEPTELTSIEYTSESIISTENSEATTESTELPTESVSSSETSTEVATEKPTEKETEKPTTPVHVHKYTTTLTKASTKANGKKVVKCTCGKVKSSSIISKIKTIKLQTNKFVYSNKAKTPVISVVDTKGVKLKKNRDYTVTYSGNHKNVGLHTAKVTFKGNYKGSKNLKFKIVPAGSSITAAKNGSLEFTEKISWTKVSSQISGYQLQFSTSKKFNNQFTDKLNVKKSLTTKEIKGLFTDKTYYIRIRTYKNIKVNGKKVTYYSKWSSVKSFKTQSFTPKAGEYTWTDPFGHVWTDRFARHVVGSDLQWVIDGYDMVTKYMGKAHAGCKYVAALNTDNFIVGGSACLGKCPYDLEKGEDLIDGCLQYSTLMSKQCVYRTWFDGVHFIKLRGFYTAVLASDASKDYEYFCNLICVTKRAKKLFEECRFSPNYWGDQGFVGMYLINGQKYNVYFCGYMS